MYSEKVLTSWCYTAASGTVDWKITCAGAIDTNGTSGFARGSTTSGSFPYSTPSANTLVIGSGTSQVTATRFLPN